MIFGKADVRRCFRRLAGVILGGVCFFGLGFIESCDDRLVEMTRYVDPCGTFLANCNPGDFQVWSADIGDYTVDPACTVPGQCDGGQPLGTITDLGP